MTMTIYRLEDLSMYFFIKDMFSDASYVKIEDSFPEKEITIPTISIDAGRLKEELFELGDRSRVRIRTWYIDVFAKNKSQRDDFGYRILERSNNGIAVYDYNSGFPPEVSPARIGHLDVLAKSYEPIPVMLDDHETQYFRGQIIIDTQNDTV